MSRIGLSQTVLPNRISCLCVESIRRIRRTPVFGVRGAASARSALSFRCKQVCLDSFFTRNTFVAGFFYPFFPPSPPIRAVLPRLVTLSHSTHFGPGENLRIFTYKILPMPNAPKDGENPKKGSISGVFYQKNARNNDNSQIVRIFHPPAPVFSPGFRPEQPPGPDRLPPFFIAGGCARTSVSPSQDHARPCGVVGGRSEGTNRSTSRVRARK